MTRSKLLARRHKETLKQFYNDPTILIAPPEKNSGCAILDRIDHVQKMLNIIEGIYKLTESTNKDDKTGIIENKLNTCSQKLKSGGQLSDQELNSLNQEDQQCQDYILFAKDSQNRNTIAADPKTAVKELLLRCTFNTRFLFDFQNFAHLSRSWVKYLSIRA